MPRDSRKGPGGSGRSRRQHWWPVPGPEPSFLVVGWGGSAVGQTPTPLPSPPPSSSLPRGVNPVWARLSLLRAPGQRSRCLLSAAMPRGWDQPRGSHLLLLPAPVVPRLIHTSVIQQVPCQAELPQPRARVSRQSLGQSSDKVSGDQTPVMRFCPWLANPFQSTNPQSQAPRLYSPSPALSPHPLRPQVSSTSSSRCDD